MGTLLEALWGYYMNQILSQSGYNLELGWLIGHEYNDFACVLRNEIWDHLTKKGEVLRIEVKSMNAGADESKAHFDALIQQFDAWDLLLVIIWTWTDASQLRFYPRVVDHFIGNVHEIAQLRDMLHIARGGSFVNRESCPDHCGPEICPHHGEPLNAAGKRERLSGPESRRVSAIVSYAANFGGLVRMLKTNSPAARLKLRQIRLENDVVHAYISFIHRNFPDEEKNQFTVSEWRQLAQHIDIPISNLSKDELIQIIRDTYPDYQEILRKITTPV